MAELRGAAEWLLVIVGLATIWLAVGLFASRRLVRRPALAHRVLGLCMVAAILTPLLRVGAALGDFGLLVDPGPTSRFHADTPGGHAAPEEAAFNFDGPAVVLAGVWTVLSLLLLLRLLIALRQSNRLARCAELEDEPDLLAGLEVAAGVDAVPELRRHPEVTTPMLWSWGRPVLLLPAGPMPLGMDPEAVFRHELAHLKRGDALWSLLAELIFVGLFWHPLAWIARRRLALYAEFACDDAVLAGGISAPCYATALLDLATGEHTPPARGALAATSQLSRRIRRLLRAKLDPCPNCSRFVSAGLVVLMLTVSTGLAVTRTRSDELREPLEAKSLPATPPKKKLPPGALAKAKKVIAIVTSQPSARGLSPETTARDRTQANAFLSGKSRLKSSSNVSFPQP